MATVYISYRRRPSAILAQLIVRDLKMRNIQAYLDTDRNDTPGTFPDRLLQAIKSADVFICLVAEGTFESEWVRHEIEHASRLSKPMIPVFQESYKPIPLDAAPTPFIKALLEHDGVQVFDQRNVYVDTAIEMLAKMVENTTAWRIQEEIVPPPSTTLPQGIPFNINNLNGQTIAQYEVGDLLGQGGMSAVYRAHQTTLNRDVAFKALAPSLVEQPEFIKRFNREMQTAARLEHPNIVPIYDYGTDSGLSYVVMRLLTGGSLANRLSYRLINDKSLPSLGEVNSILIGLSAGLDYAHSRGVIHSDIKTHNIILDDQGTPFLVDFGMVEIATDPTATDTVMGTPSYMSPEQWKGESVTPATDQYALGIIIYQLLTGRLPFEANTPYALMNKHLNEQPTAPEVWRTDLPPTVKDVLAKSMAKNPQKRYPSVRDFAADFGKAIEGNRGKSTAFFTAPMPKVSPASSQVTSPPYSNTSSTKSASQPTTKTKEVAKVVAKSVKPMSIFVSYAKHNYDQQQILVKALEIQGHKVWFDRELSSKGGQNWWNIILKAIYDAELFVFALAPEALKSEPCRREYTYANELGKRILPVEIKSINHDLLPTALSKIQTVSFWGNNGQRLLLEALANLPAPQPLPVILPPPPDAPIHRINEISEKVITMENIPYFEQHQLISELQEMLENNEKTETVLDVLKELKNRDDFSAKLNSRVTGLINRNTKRGFFRF